MHTKELNWRRNRRKSTITRLMSSGKTDTMRGRSESSLGLSYSRNLSTRSRSTLTIKSTWGSLPRGTSMSSRRSPEISKSRRAPTDAQGRNAVALIRTAHPKIVRAIINGHTKSSLSHPREARVPSTSHLSIIVNSSNSNSISKLMWRHLLPEKPRAWGILKHLLH